MYRDADGFFACDHHTLSVITTLVTLYLVEHLQRGAIRPG